MTSYQWAYNDMANRAVENLKPSPSIEKMSPLEKQVTEIVNDKHSPKALKSASKALLDGLHDLGPAWYHHHYHNAIIGNKDADARYNNKWTRRKRNSHVPKLTETVGAVGTCTFARGQGGIFTKVENPLDVQQAASVIARSLRKKTVMDLGNDHD